MNYFVKEVSKEEASVYILDIHYAKRWPSVSYCYGLFRDNILCGIVTYGTPFSSTLRKGVAGIEHQEKVLELNRLCLKDNLKNEASILISKSLRLLPKNKIIVSFADTSQDHLGTIYQATNFIYYGLSAKRTDWAIKGREHLHGQTISDEFRGVPNRAIAVREKYGDDFYLKPRPRKHRYITFTGGKRFKKLMKNNIKYKECPYPKDNKEL